MSRLPRRRRPSPGRSPSSETGSSPLKGGERSVKGTLVDKVRNLAWLKAYVTDLVDQPAEFVIGAYPPALAHREKLPYV